MEFCTFNATNFEVYYKNRKDFVIISLCSVKSFEIYDDFVRISIREDFNFMVLFPSYQDIHLAASSVVSLEQNFAFKLLKKQKQQFEKRIKCTARSTCEGISRTTKRLDTLLRSFRAICRCLFVRLRIYYPIDVSWHPLRTKTVEMLIVDNYKFVTAEAKNVSKIKRVS